MKQQPSPFSKEWWDEKMDGDEVLGFAPTGFVESKIAPLTSELQRKGLSLEQAREQARQQLGPELASRVKRDTRSLMQKVMHQIASYPL